MLDVPAIFGSMVFNDKAMKERLPKAIYNALRDTIQIGQHLSLDVANEVASAMRDWAVENGATHYSHWFQPMTSVTAEKHDSFISPDAKGGIIMDFSGKALVSGESDASSLPSGGLRATFEARGYTAWDPTSYAFIKEGTLYIPTAFCSYSGDALDKKTPLLRSMQAVSKQALRVLRILGNTEAKSVIANVGPEQEYFLIDKEVYLKRPDLIYCGRTLFGARPPKGQELEDHFYGKIKPRVAAFMKELDEELWKLGVLAKTKHNEVAPGQHELAMIYTTANIATDHNQLTMELMKSIANKHNLACLLHEKPFAGVNGSGKHNNWSLDTDLGESLFKPGDTPAQNAQFLLFLCAVIKAVDEYQDLLRVSTASAGNDHRLGSHEAPPAIVSIFIGEELEEILTAIEKGERYVGKEKALMEIGATVLPHFPRDATDRNRTSPFAFAGNKFEFRMLGSAFSVAGPNIIINTMVAEALSGFADDLENSTNLKQDMAALIKETIKKHRRIIFNGNNYSEEWIVEAQKRGLLNLRTTPEALPYFASDKNIALFEKHGVFTSAEIHSRLEILLGNYSKTINIEAFTMIDLVNKEVIPSVINYQNALAKLLHRKQKLSGEYSMDLENSLLERVSSLAGALNKKLETLSVALIEVNGDTPEVTAMQHREKVFVAMNELRCTVDELEAIVGREYWSLPVYSEIFYSVN